MKIKKAFLAYEPEKFKTAFGFKGNILSGVWQTAVCLSDGGNFGVGLGVQSVLWSDSGVFARFGEDRGNALMYDVTKHTVSKIEGAEFSSPRELTGEAFAIAYKYIKDRLGEGVTETFALNALVPLDFAAWQLYCRENGISDFDKIYKGTYKSDYLANIPLITYNTPVAEVAEMAKRGVCIFKIKLGSDPERDGDAKKMLEWDKRRAAEIHKALCGCGTDYTESKRAVYYFDANGRYDTIERLEELVEFLDKEGILAQTVLFEEPFEPENKIFVGDLPVCFAADESAHSLKDVRERIELGYGAVTLKPIAKTLSVTIDMADYAQSAGAQCFCADLTVNPVMVEWNKNFAARLSPIRGMKIGVVESNGAQNYVNWEKMRGYLPEGVAGGDEVIYKTDAAFYKNAGGIFETPRHYFELIKKQNGISEV